MCKKPFRYVKVSVFCAVLILLICSSAQFCLLVDAQTPKVNPGAANDDYAYAVVQTEDGGYAIAGYTRPNNSPDRDFWVVKTNQLGDIQWSKTYGGSKDDWASSIVQTTDGFLILGTTNSYGNALNNFYLVKTNMNGDLIWNMTYGENGDEVAYSVCKTTDGGYFGLAGSTNDTGGKGSDFYLVKIDSSGKKAWSNKFGGFNDDVAESVVEVSDGAFAVAGYSKSGETEDAWLVITNPAGDLFESKLYGGSGYDGARSLVKTKDNGFALAGYTTSNEISESYRDFLLVKTNSAGEMEWNKTYGGPNSDGAQSVIQAKDGGFALAGYTNPFGSSESSWLVKTNSAGEMEWNKTYGATNGAKTESVIQTNDGGFALAGYTHSYNGTRDFYLVKADSSGDVEWSQTYDGGGASSPKPAFPWYFVGALLAAIAVVSAGGLALYKSKQKKLKDRDYYSEGTSYYNSRRYQEAADSFGKALEANPKNFEAMLGQGGALSSLQRYQEAVNSFNRALEINSKSYEAWVGKGGCLCSLQRYEEASNSYDKAIEINPEKGDVFYNRGACLFNIGRFEEAIANFDKALGINPEDTAAKEAKASALQKMKQ